MAGKGATASSSSHLLVAAFDFGTTYSGYAFSFRDDPMKIQTNQGWNAGSEKLISLKTPTCVLLRPNKQFDSFGFEAENRYADLAEDNKHHGWMLFKRFKMLLHNNDGLTRASTVEDINGKSMPAMQIFSMAIGFLRDHLLKALNTQTAGVNEHDLQYVITVPAIWNDNAKQFMREAATEAGLDSSRLKLSLEPEAASIWCQTVATDLKKSFDVGCQYMVVDLGGGTADISVHEKKADGSLKEIHKASGGPWGGTAVDKNYFHWLTNLFGQRTMERFKREQMADYFDVQREFEIKKRNIMTDTTGKITFRLSASLREIYEEVEGANLKRKVADMGLADKVTFTSDKLRLDVSIVRGWFKGPINEIIVHMKNLLAEEKMKNVKKILLVGGFGECQLVQENLRNQLQNKTVIVPNEAGLAVLKGAVRFGHLPTIVSSRVMKYTYGVAVVHVNDNESKSGSDTEYNHAGDDDCYAVHGSVSDDDDQHHLYVEYQGDDIFNSGEETDDENSSVDDYSDDNDEHSSRVEYPDDEKSNSDEESDDDKSVVEDVFDKFVEVGEEIPIGHEVKRDYTPTNPECADILVYCTSDPDPALVTDPGCEELGVLSIEFPDGETCEDNKIETTLIFGDTELIVKAKILRTGLEFFTRIDCLK